jgi:hypothetical protein
LADWEYLSVCVRQRYVPWVAVCVVLGTLERLLRLLKLLLRVSSHASDNKRQCEFTLSERWHNAAHSSRRPLSLRARQYVQEDYIVRSYAPHPKLVHSLDQKSCNLTSSLRWIWDHTEGEMHARAQLLIQTQCALLRHQGETLFGRASPEREDKQQLFRQFSILIENALIKTENIWWKCFHIISKLVN